MTTCHKIFLTACAIICVATRANAQDAAAEKNDIAFKLTSSYYDVSDSSHAFDVNLRGSIGAHTTWVGFYKDSLSFKQTRTGYEYRGDFNLIRTVASIQAASGGFAGGSLMAELGDENYVIAGWGRTNLKDYYNLNFDPNDAITLGIGSRAFKKTEVSLFHIWDDRLHSRQRVTHAVIRYKPTELQRWIIDVSQKQGLISGDSFIRGYAVSVTYDFGNFFARIARDQYVNFSNDTQNRFSLGMRF